MSNRFRTAEVEKSQCAPGQLCGLRSRGIRSGHLAIETCDKRHQSETRGLIVSAHSWVHLFVNCVETAMYFSCLCCTKCEIVYPDDRKVKRHQVLGNVEL